MSVEIGGHYGEVFNSKDFLEKLKYNIKSEGNVMQIFMGDKIHTTLRKKFKPTTKEIKLIKDTLKKKKTKLFIHANLRINLAAPPEHQYLWNHQNVIYDMNLGKKMGAKGVVVHLGTRTLQGKLQTEKAAYQNMKKSIHYIIKNSPPVIPLILEVNAGQNNKIGKTIKEIERIYKSLTPSDKKRIGFCWDTAHLFTAGYHMDTIDGVQAYLREFKERIGYGKILVTHMNDSAAEFGSGIDRHESLGLGHIYKNNNWEPLEIIAELLRKEKVPLVLETRNEKRYAYEIELVRDLAKKGKYKLSKMKGGGKNKKSCDCGPRLQLGGTSSVVPILRKMQTLHTLLGNQHQARAYRNNVKLIETYLLQKDLDNIRANDLDELQKLEGMGKETISKIQEIMQTGTLSRLKELLKAVPYKEKEIEKMIELEKVMGIGPKIAKKMVEQKIKGIDDLKRKVKSGNWKTTEMQKIGIKYYDDLLEKIPRREIEKWRDLIIKKINKPDSEGVLAGSYRLGKKQSGDIDLIVLLPNIKNLEDLKKKGEKVMNEIIASLKSILVDYIRLGETEFLGMVKNKKISNKARHLDLKIVPRDSLPFFLLYFGSGERFSRKIRSEAKKQGYKLNQYGLFKGKKAVPIKTEKDIFQKLGMEYVEPCNRLY